MSDYIPQEWRCACGGAWEITNLHMFNPNEIRCSKWSIWRYSSLLGLDTAEGLKEMGVGWTPLVPLQIFNRSVYFKLEYLMPTGSFKDRGVNVMINHLASLDVQSIVEDSSGNAGASVAAHGAFFGIHTKIFIPENTSQNKQEQIAVYGAETIRINGTRKNVEDAAQSAITLTTVYASHVYSPTYLAGQSTLAFEIWEQLNGKVPDWVICPLGQGGQLLGLWFGFSRLFQAGLIYKIPRLVAVQSAKVAPVYHAWEIGADLVDLLEAPGNTIAEGVAIIKPVRSKRILQAIKESNGLVMAITESEILSGQNDLAKIGFFVEPTSALVIGALKKLTKFAKKNDSILLTLTGNGLKN